MRRADIFFYFSMVDECRVRILFPGKRKISTDIRVDILYLFVDGSIDFLRGEYARGSDKKAALARK